MMRSILAILVLLLSFAIHAEKITAVGDPWPPFLDPTEPKNGIIVEIATAAYATQGYELEMIFVPWARAIKGVKNASYDLLLGTWMTEERKAFLMYSDTYLSNSIKFLKQKGNDFDYKGIESLSGLSVGVVRDYGYGDEILKANNFRRPETKDFISNARKLAAGRIDLTLEDEIVARAIIAKKQPELLDKIDFTETAYSTNTLHVTCGLANAKHEELINAFNKGLAEIKKNGEYERIINSINK